jgi:hypothetical protein
LGKRADAAILAIDREARLDAILQALWHDWLSAELGMPYCRARAEVDGFLRD